MKWKVAYLPGVREEDIKNAPREYQEAFVLILRSLAHGDFTGLPLGNYFDELKGYRKSYVNTPEDARTIEQNKRLPPSKKVPLNREGAYRIVYREVEVRGVPTILVAAFGPRKNNEVYHQAVERITALENARARRDEALKAASLPRDRAIPRSASPSSALPPQGPRPTQPRRGPSL